MANIVRIGSKSPKILGSKMVWLGVRNGAKMVKIGGKWGEKSKIFQAVPGSKWRILPTWGYLSQFPWVFGRFLEPKTPKNAPLAPLAPLPELIFFLNI